jgi:hypothetical protein
MLCRSNVGSANTRAIKKALAGKVESVTVKSSGYCGGYAEVHHEEIEPVMFARDTLVKAGFVVGDIKTYKGLGYSVFFVEPKSTTKGKAA